MKYWYNVNTGQIEEDDATSRKENLLGPYSSREEAAHALELAKQRTEAWDEEDRLEAEKEGRD